MPPEVLYDSPFATMWYYPENKIIHHQIHKFIFGQEFQNLMLAGMNAVKKYHAKKWLSNDRSNAMLRKEDVEWSGENWLPQALQAGWKYWAIVLPTKSIGRKNMEDSARDSSAMGLITRVFDSEEEALRWLESQPD